MIEGREIMPNIKNRTIPFFIAVRTAAALCTIRCMAAAAAVEVYTTAAALLVRKKKTTYHTYDRAVVYSGKYSNKFIKYRYDVRSS